MGLFLHLCKKVSPRRGIPFNPLFIVLRNNMEQNTLPEKNEPQSEEITASSTTLIQQTYVGPTPPASELAALERIEQGMANRVLTMTEKEQESIHAMRKATMELHKEEVAIAKRGQIFGFSLAALSLGMTTYLAANGHSVESIAGLLVALGTLAASFFNKPKT